MKVTTTVQNGIPSARSEAVGRKDTGTARSSSSAERSTADRVELSDTLERVSRLTKVAMTMETDNTEKIQSIRERLAAGTYTISGRDVAEKMLRSAGIISVGGDE